MCWVSITKKKKEKEKRWNILTYSIVSVYQSFKFLFEKVMLLQSCTANSFSK